MCFVFNLIGNVKTVTLKFTKIIQQFTNITLIAIVGKPKSPDGRKSSPVDSIRGLSSAHAADKVPAYMPMRMLKSDVLIVFIVGFALCEHTNNSNIDFVQ